jgi:glucose/mannose-6-phosphate isomerase
MLKLAVPFPGANMKTYVENFPAQLEEALSIAGKVNLSGINKNSVQHIFITGLGGSGISGTILSELVADSCPFPILVNKDYSLPAYVGTNTLVIACSYSGNTEETIAVLNAALEKKAQIICISSGGKVSEIATQHKLSLIAIPGGNPPRASFGYPFVQLLKIFEVLNFSKPGFTTQLENVIAVMRSGKNEITGLANEIAEKLHGQLPVIYSISGNEGVAVRFRQQINENSKMLCWHHVIPEMNHNELVGWVDKHPNISVVALRTSTDHPRSVKRLEICKEIISPLVKSWIEISPKGNTKLEQTLYLIHLTDWVSCFLADLKAIDPVEVKVIDRLKNQLAQF